MLDGTQPYTRSPDLISVRGFSLTDASAEATLESALVYNIFCCFTAHIITDFVLVIIFIQELAVRGGQF